jgi:hypothetical protein
MNYGNSSVSIGGCTYFVGASSTTYSSTYTYGTTASVFYTVSYYPSPSPKINPSCEAEIEGLISFEED